MSEIQNMDWVELKEPIVSYGMKSNLKFEEETYQILKACFEVHNNLGSGFLESVYHEALEIEFKLRNIPFVSEKGLTIFYKDHKLNKNYEADFLVFDTIILELKAQDGALEKHYKQVLNYLKASKREVALLVNFGQESLKYKRIVFAKH